MKPLIAIDAMGGDEGVRVMMEGAALARHRHERFKFLMVGDQAQIKTALDTHPNLRGASEILHADSVVSGDDKPSREALRSARKSSMGLAINAVKEGNASAAVSAGNTGMLMATQSWRCAQWQGLIARHSRPCYQHCATLMLSCLIWARIPNVMHEIWCSSR